MEIEEYENYYYKRLRRIKFEGIRGNERGREEQSLRRVGACHGTTPLGLYRHMIEVIKRTGQAMRMSAR